MFITIAGMSNVLSGFADDQTHSTVIAYPPNSDKEEDSEVYSSLRVISEVALITLPITPIAALAASKIIGLSNPHKQKKIAQHQEKKRAEIEVTDKNIQLHR